MDSDTETTLKCVVDGQKSLEARLRFAEKEVKFNFGKLEARIDKLNETENRMQSEQVEILTTLRLIADKQNTLLEERQNSMEFWRAMREKIAYAGIMGTLGLLASALWFGILHLIQSGPKV